MTTGSIFPSSEITYEENNYYDRSGITWPKSKNSNQSENEKMKNNYFKLPILAPVSDEIIFEENNYYVSGDFSKTEVEPKTNDVTSGNNDIMGTFADIDLVENEYYAGSGFNGNKFEISEHGVDLHGNNQNPEDIILEENNYYASTSVLLNIGQSSLSALNRHPSNKEQINPDIQMENSDKPKSVLYLDLLDESGQTIPASERNDITDELEDAKDDKSYYNTGLTSSPASKVTKHQTGNMYDPVILSRDNSDDECTEEPGPNYDYTYVSY
jgi:hypothetical protein